jgi:hypothetical protein
LTFRLSGGFPKNKTKQDKKKEEIAKQRKKRDQFNEEAQLTISLSIFDFFLSLLLVSHRSLSKPTRRKRINYAGKKRRRKQTAWPRDLRVRL